MFSFFPYSIFPLMDWDEFIRELFRLAEPYLKIRGDLPHAQVSHRYALRLLEEEGGESRIVEPAVILHDVGWSRLEPEQIKIAFGVRAGGQEAERLNRIHEREGAAIARRILESLRYNPQWIERIVSFIERHDSGDQPDSLEEKLVKDADKLWRFSPVGFWNERERQGLDPVELYQFLLERYRSWFFTSNSIEIGGGRIAGPGEGNRRRQPRVTISFSKTKESASWPGGGFISDFQQRQNLGTSDCVPRSKIYRVIIQSLPVTNRGTITRLTNRLPDPLVLEGPGAVSVQAQPQAPVIDRLSAQISMMLQDLDEGFHPVFLLHLLDKVKASKIDRPFNDHFRRGPIAVSVPKEFFSHLTKTLKKALICSHSPAVSRRCSWPSSSMTI